MRFSKKLVVILGLGVVLLLAAGCTDAEVAKNNAYGSQFVVTLYSGGKPARVWVSTGRVETEEKSDGWYFRDSRSRKLVRVSGAVTVEEQ